MPRAVDPPGRYPTADMDPAQRADQRLDITTFPGFDWIGWFIGELRKIVHAIITFLVDALSFFTGGLIDLSPIHEIIDEIIDSIIEDLGTGENLLKLWRVIVSIIETATGVNLTRVFMELLPAIIGLMNDLVTMAGATGQAVFELIMLPLNILRQIQNIFSGQPADLTGIGEAFQPIVNTFTSWWAAVGTHLPDAINQAAQALWYIAELLYSLGLNSIQNLGGLINDLANGLRNAIAGAGITLDQTLAAAGTALGQAIAGASEGIVAVLEGAGITITGTLQQAGQELGGAIIAAQDALWNMIGAAGINLGQTLNDAGAMLGQFVTAARDNAQGVIDALNNAAQGVQQGVGATLSTAYENFNALINAIPTFLQGLAEGGKYGQAGMNAALEAQAAANAAKAAEIAAMQSAFAAVFNVNPVGGGSVSRTIDFTAMPNQSSMSGVMLPGGGAMGIIDGAVTWQGGDGDDFQLFPTPTESDYQVMEINLGVLHDLLLNISGQPVVYIDGILRSNAARNTCLRLRLYSVGGLVYAQLLAMVNGGVTLLAQSAPITTLAGGGRVRVIAGNPGAQALWAIQVLYNGIPIITYDDVSHVSQVGAGFRYVGLYMLAWAVGAQQIYANANVGNYSYSMPYWATNIDGILLGGGGGGKGMPLIGAWGEGGWNGSWSVFRIKRGDDPDAYATHRLPWSTTQITGSVGGAGHGGAGGGAGGAGGATNSIVNVDGTPTQIGYGAGGAGGWQSNLDTPGKAPNPTVLNYWGNNYDSAGYGHGGNASIVTLANGAPGTSGRVWYRASNPIQLRPPTVTTVSYQDNPPPAALYPIAALPPASVKGRVYLPSDTGLLLRDNGERWDRFLGGPLGAFTAPPDAGWNMQLTTVGGNTPTWSKSLDGYALLVPAQSPTTFQYVWRPYPAGAFELTVYIESDYLHPNGIPPATGNAANTGIIISDGTRVLLFGHAVVNIAAGAPWIAGNGWYVMGTSMTTHNSGAGNYPTANNNFVPLVWMGGKPNWLRFTDNGVNRTYSYSFNGTDWRTYRTVARTDFLTPVRIGIGGRVDALATDWINTRLRSWRGVP